MKQLIFIFLFCFPVLGESALPCPVHKRHVANNGAYFEMGGASIYASAGYTLAINGGFFYNYYWSLNIGYVLVPEAMRRGSYGGITAAAEFHGCFYKNSSLFWTAGLGYAQIHPTGVESNPDRLQYLSPMVGIEFLFKNRYGMEFKYQPNIIAGNKLNTENFTSLVGVKLKAMFGRTREGSYGRYF